MAVAEIDLACVVGPGRAAGRSRQVLNALINGVALGAVYALLALGFVIIFKATQVINFAHGVARRDRAPS